MSIGRNAPCPCGSGRKYKHCCLGRENDLVGDTYSDSPFATISTGRRRAHQAGRDERCWEIDAVPLVARIADGSSHRPVAVFVTAGEYVLDVQMKDRPGGESEDIAALLDRAVSRCAADVGSYPEEVLVRFAELVPPLAGRLSSRDVRVRLAPELPNLERAARDMMRDLMGEEQWPPVGVADSWSAWRLPAAQVKAIFEGAAHYWARGPWKILADDQYLTATMPSGREWTACVLGNAGQSFGLNLYSEADDFVRMILLDAPEEALARQRGRTVTISFLEQAELPDAMVREARLAGWSTAGPGAFPVAYAINSPGGGITRADAGDAATLLRAIADFVDAHQEDLRLEDLSRVPAPRTEWTHPKLGVRVIYDADERDERFERLAESEPGAGARSPLGNLDPALVEDLDFEALFHEAVAAVGGAHDDDRVLTEMNRRIGETVSAHNRRPRAEMAGLSSEQVARLIRDDWSAADPPIRLEPDLPAGAVGGSPLLANARLLLSEAAAQGRLPATQAGNLTLAVVDSLLDRLQPPELSKKVRSVCKRIREHDVWTLHEVRVVLELARLLARRKGAFHATARARKLLEERRQGQLYTVLFGTYFREFNLAYSGFGPEWRGLQATFPFTLYALSRSAHRWRQPAELVHTVVLPAVREELGETPLPDWDSRLLASRVLTPLCDFGLLEVEETGTQSEGRVTRQRSYRKTALFDRFIRFDL
jgi:hypothetical protein